MTIRTGERLPDVTLIEATADGPEQVAVRDFFAGRRIALFAVPGAFTPTCSAKHLPGFVAQADAFAAKGIDMVACTAVNDAFVLAAWGAANSIGDRVTMLADGNAEFAAGLGLSTDSSRYGMGTRSRRYAMVVDDGVVEALYVEEPGEFRVSSAEHLLSTL